MLTMLCDEGHAPTTEIINLLIGLIDILKVDKTVEVLVEADKHEIVFTLCSILSFQPKLGPIRQEFIKEFFI